MRHLGLMAAVVACALAGAVVGKLHSRWGAMCANVPCSSLQTRLGVIEQMIAARPRGPAYLVIGDSLTEIGRWPAMCGREPVAAGISGARADTWLPHAKGLADALEPDFVVLALGTNDVLSQGSGPTSSWRHRSPAIASLRCPCTRCRRRRSRRCGRPTRASPRPCRARRRGSSRRRPTAYI